MTIPVPTPSPIIVPHQIPGHVQICYYCHQIITQVPPHHGIDNLVVVLVILGNVCIILSFLAAWIRHRMRIKKKLAMLQAEIESPGNITGPEAELIVYARLGHFALVKIPTHVMIRTNEQPGSVQSHDRQDE